MSDERNRPQPREKGDTKAHQNRSLVCLASTPGGHLTQLELIARHLDGFETIVVTTRSPHADSVLLGLPRRYVLRIQRNPAAFLLNMLQSVYIAIKERPDWVISTGAGDTLALMFVAAAIGIPVLFVESPARVRTPSLTGRLIRRWADLVIIRWPFLLHFYPKAILAGPGIGSSRVESNLPLIPSIVVLTGTGTHGFDGPLAVIDRLVLEGKLPPSVFAQVGASRYAPHAFRYAKFLPHRELLERIRSADLVVTHDGAASIMESLGAGKPTIVIPREPTRGELTYRSAAELAKYLADKGWIVLVDNPSRLPEAIEKLRSSPPQFQPISGCQPWQVVLDFLHKTA